MDIIEAGAAPKRRGSVITKGIVWLGLLVVVLGLVMYARVQLKYVDQIVTIEAIPAEYETAIVFGAGLIARGTPGGVLEDRILTAIDSYQAGKVSQLLMSGDNSSANHNEVAAMENLALEKGLPAESIVLDPEGISTFESCLRARDEFKLDRVVLMTQKYHLRRALYICNELGLDAIGVDAARRSYSKQLRYTVREIPASIADWVETLIRK